MNSSSPYHFSFELPHFSSSLPRIVTPVILAYDSGIAILQPKTTERTIFSLVSGASFAETSVTAERHCVCPHLSDSFPLIDSTEPPPTLPRLLSAISRSLLQD